MANPELFKYEHFRQAALAVAVGIAIQVIIQIPVISAVNSDPSWRMANVPKIIGLKFTLYLLSWIINFEQATWDDKLLDGLQFLNKSVLQVPFLLMTFMGYVTPTLDEM